MDFAIIGLSGKAGVGKSRSKDYLKFIIENDTTNYRFGHLSFAQKLKDIAYSVFSWDGDKTLYPEPDRGRALLINIGTKFREIRENVWVDYVTDKVSNDIMTGNANKTIYVIDDFRFQNELGIFRQKFGNKFIWARIKRNCAIIESDSETNLDSCSDEDFLIDNNGTEVELVAKLRELYLIAISRSRERIHA